MAEPDMREALKSLLQGQE